MTSLSPPSKIFIYTFYSTVRILGTYTRYMKQLRHENVAYIPQTAVFPFLYQVPTSLQTEKLSTERFVSCRFGLPLGEYLPSQNEMH